MALAKFATPDEARRSGAQIRRMSVADRAYVAAELMHDARESGRITEPSAVHGEILRRAGAARVDPGEGVSREQAVTSARRAVLDARRRL